jgi:hypothetical protein
VTLIGRANDVERTRGEYVLKHAGAFSGVSETR